MGDRSPAGSSPRSCAVNPSQSALGGTSADAQQSPSSAMLVDPAQLPHYALVRLVLDKSEMTSER